MTIQLESVSDTEFVIVLSERFDFGAVEEFRKSYESINPKRSAHIVISFRKTKYMDSSALGMLINARANFDTEKVKMTLRHCSSQIKKIFSISRFDKKFDIE